MTQAPGPRPWPLLGHAWHLRRNLLDFLQQAQARHGDVVRLQLGPQVMHLVSSPGLAREVLQTRAADFDRRTRSVALLMDLTQESLLTSQEGDWLRRRRLAAPAFQTERLRALVPLFARGAQDLVEAWQQEGRQELAPGPAMTALAFRLTREALFSAGDDPDADRLEPAVADILDHYWRRMGSLSDWPHRLPTPSRSRYRAGLRLARGMVDRILVARTSQAGFDLLEDLLEAYRSKGLSDQDLRNEILTLLLAGHETTAQALAWTLLELARHPDAARRLQEEADRVLEGRLPEGVDLEHLPWTRAVFLEALRLHPTIWILERRAVQATTLQGMGIPRHSSVLVSPYVIHRHPTYWREPERFDPTRFLDHPDPEAYLPFGLGPHTCLGKGFALVEALSVLPVLLRAFDLAPVPGSPDRPVAGLTLRTPPGLTLRLIPRS